MSLERGVMLWRLNQALLPDPGRPIARITVPLGEGGETTAGVARSGTAGALTVAGAVSRPLPPRPRRRRRLRLAASLEFATCGRVSDCKASGEDSVASGASISIRSAGGSGSGMADSAGIEVSASKYFGCNGADTAVRSGFGFSAACLRRLKRSLIHLRMFGL